MNAIEVYKGSDGNVTRLYYERLQLRGNAGVIAMNLFRAQKCSARAKKYRGGIRGKGSYSSMAYERKAYSLDQLCSALVLHAPEFNIRFGWKRDDSQPPCTFVLYVDLPEGQVSFHSTARYAGPDYPGEWDGIRGVSDVRILKFCDRVWSEFAAGGAMAIHGHTQTHEA